MLFHRFEALESKALTPDLSTGRGPVIEGQYMYFCRSASRRASTTRRTERINCMLIL
jgi:hypothetical protein